MNVVGNFKGKPGSQGKEEQRTWEQDRSRLLYLAAHDFPGSFLVSKPSPTLPYLVDSQAGL